MSHSSVLATLRPPDVAPEATYRHAQNLSRGLRVLRVLNDAVGGEATSRDVSDVSGLNRSTVKRILETLVTEGYVRRCGEGGRYALMPAVLALSKGLTEEARLVENASSVLRDLGGSTGWSLRLATVQNDRMTIRHSTHSQSRLAREFSVGVQNTLPILLTAAGRAYFACVDAPQRQRLVDCMRANPSEQSAVARDPRLVELLTQRVRDAGYGANDGDWGERQLRAVALPIRGRTGRPLASISMIFPRGVSEAHIEQDFLPLLGDGVARLEAAL